MKGVPDKKKRDVAVYYLAHGYKAAHAAREAGLARPSIYRLMKKPEFMAQVEAMKAKLAGVGALEPPPESRAPASPAKSSSSGVPPSGPQGEHRVVETRASAMVREAFESLSEISKDKEVGANNRIKACSEIIKNLGVRAYVSANQEVTDPKPKPASDPQPEPPKPKPLTQEEVAARLRLA